MRRLAAVAAIVLVSVLLVACGEAEANADSDLAPDFAAMDAQGQEVMLSGLLEGHTGIVLVFYRGFF